eukprot:8624751-Ditylum_brightwellii.AAC.1
MLITSKLHDGSGSKHKARTQQVTDQRLLYELQADGGIKGDIGPVGAGGKENWKQVAENLKRLGGRMKNADKKQDNDNPPTIPQTLYLFGVRMQKRLLKASELTRYYATVGHHLTVSNTVYKTVIRSFTNQWAGLKDCKHQIQLVVPKITRELPIMQWVGIFDDFLSRKIG